MRSPKATCIDVKTFVTRRFLSWPTGADTATHDFIDFAVLGLVAGFSCAAHAAVISMSMPTTVRFVAGHFRSI